MYDKPKTSTPEDQLRLDKVYDIIKNKLDFSVSQNPKLIISSIIIMKYPNLDYVYVLTLV